VELPPLPPTRKKSFILVVFNVFGSKMGLAAGRCMLDSFWSIFAVFLVRADVQNTVIYSVFATFAWKKVFLVTSVLPSAAHKTL